MSNFQPSKTPCVCIALRRVTQKVTDFYDQALKSTGININQYSLLINIKHIEGCGTGELAQRVGLEKSTLVRTLQPLLRDGFVIDGAPQNSRSRQLYLSEKGQTTLKKAQPLWSKAQEDVIHQLGVTAKSFGKILDSLYQLE